MSTISNLLLIAFTFLTGNISEKEWKTINFNDSLEVFLNGKLAGSLQCGISIKDSVIEVSNVLDIGTSMMEKRVYRFDGSLIYAEQIMNSPSGKNDWKLFNSTNRCTLFISTGGVIHRKNVPVVHESIRSIYDIYNGILKSSIKAGDKWSDTAFELTSAEHVFAETVCKEIPDNKNGNVWVFNCTNSITGKVEVWKIDQKGKTVYRELYPFVARVNENSSKNDTVQQSDFFETFKIPALKRAGPGQRIIISFDSLMSIDSSVLSYYQKDVDGYILKSQNQSCSEKPFQEKLDDSLLKYTVATPIMQTSHPDLVKISKKLQKNAESACELVKICNDYVYKSVRKQNTATFSSAVETLKSGFGDCGEHAVLLAALLRAAGIPAKVVLGIVYMESGKGYYYHAWVSAYTGEWLFSDPSHGIFPSNHDRIPLIIDDTGQRMLQLAKFIGRIKVEHK